MYDKLSLSPDRKASELESRIKLGSIGFATLEIDPKLALIGFAF
jgi:hypothetical protein